MLHFAEIIVRLRNECPVFERRIGGTAAFRAANQPNAQIKMPHAFVVPMVENAAAKSASGTAQQILERFAVIVAVDNAYNEAAGAGMEAQTHVVRARKELFNALVGWEAVGWADTIQFNRGIHLDMNQTRLWHQFEFAFSYYLDTDTPPADAFGDDDQIASAIRQLFVRYGNTEPLDLLVGAEESVSRTDGPISYNPGIASIATPTDFHGNRADESQPALKPIPDQGEI